ncbi:MAG: DUF2935 domain-containing protein [Desulfitobacteriaceae bacterium]|nr:DUF2935 domain-containing protein [Desulfitobacteriaceae bacterium]MDD4753123.1 DUF2935 domain-containing protein [Desulfitobacteriaceae bacterium]
MYCFTYAHNINCIFNELLLWSEISSEHPIIIKTVAELTNKKLSSDILRKLTEVTETFSDLKDRVETVRQDIYYSPYYYYGHVQRIRGLIEDFLLHDRNFLAILPELKEYGKDDMVWQELIEHIIKEQQFMYKLFQDLRLQLGGYPRA